MNTRFIELAGEVNRAMPEWVVGKIAQALNERGRAIKGSKILVLGLAYKKNVDDVRESPAARIMELLRERGALLNYADPHVPEFPRMREHQFELESIFPDAAMTLAAVDRLVHHATILEMNVESYRRKVAARPARPHAPAHPQGDDRA